MDLLRSQSGTVKIKLTSADVAALLSKISEKNIVLEHLITIDEMTVQADILRKDLKLVEEITDRNGVNLQVVGKSGLYWNFVRLRKRPVFLFSVVVLLLMTIFLPSRILFVRVEGNQTIPTKQILEEGDRCGISIFATRRKVRSEKVKNALIESIPELQWVGINTKGWVATIHVTEKTVTKQETPKEGIYSVVATRDGIITDLTVFNGTALCRVGQAVKTGQMLVSGYVDCGLFVKGTQADGEIYAQTMREIGMLTPKIQSKRGQIKQSKRKFSIIFGKKLIKLYKGSGISDASCVKIYDERKLTFPGGFELPIALVCETITELEFVEDNQPHSYDWMADQAASYLNTQMIAGQIQNQELEYELLDDVCYLKGQFACTEMIGQIVKEEFIQR